MNTFGFTFSDAQLEAMPSGGLWWPDERLLVVSDMHLGKSERLARRGGAFLPPYEVAETLTKLEQDISHTDPATVICLGDSFDDSAASLAISDANRAWISRLTDSRKWVWITGNHDPAPHGIPGQIGPEYTRGGLTFRHIADARTPIRGEVSGHYHPKCSVRLRGGQNVSRACFLVDDDRLIVPAYGTYTGGLRCQSAPLSTLMAHDARAILIGQTPCAVPMPR